jgi:hypothetical protein
MALHQTEWALQRACAAFLSKALPADAYFTSIDIGRSTSAAQGQLRKLRGCKAGVPDMLIVSSDITLWLELKAGASLSAPQKLTRDALVLNGHYWALCRSMEDVEVACRSASIPLRATLGQIRERIAIQNEHLPAKKPKRASPRKAGPRYTLGNAAVRRAKTNGVQV